MIDAKTIQKSLEDQLVWFTVTIGELTSVCLSHLVPEMDEETYLDLSQDPQKLNAVMILRLRNLSDDQTSDLLVDTVDALGRNLENVPPRIIEIVKAKLNLPKNIEVSEMAKDFTSPEFKDFLRNLGPQLREMIVYAAEQVTASAYPVPKGANVVTDLTKDLH